MLLISSCTKPYLPAELTLQNLSAVLASFMCRLGHVPENAVEVCVMFIVVCKCLSGRWLFMESVSQRLVRLAGVVVRTKGLSLTPYL